MEAVGADRWLVSCPRKCIALIVVQVGLIVANLLALLLLRLNTSIRSRSDVERVRLIRIVAELLGVKALWTVYAWIARQAGDALEAA